MNKSTFNKEALDVILTELEYYMNFKNTFLNRRYDIIDYGPRIGRRGFDNFFAAADNYAYSNQVDEHIFSGWNEILNDEESTEEDLFCTILEIFVWGDVLKGNVKTAIKLYKDKKLKLYIRQVIKLLKRKEILSKDFKSHLKENMGLEIIWSSGWTKVYSFINDSILIYDSRVSAFLNHTLTHNANYTEDQLDSLKGLTKYLFNFKGAKGRERLVDTNLYGFKNSNPNGVNGLNANLISSWTVELINEKLELHKTIRSFERAFFMLGFDLQQIRQEQ